MAATSHNRRQGLLFMSRWKISRFLMRRLLSHSGQADREGLPAGVETVALGARLGSAIAPAR
jgi:hypothetical protein